MLTGCNGKRLAKVAIAIISCISISYADDLAVETPRAALNRVGREIVGNTVPANLSDGSRAGEWAFWYIESGDAPEEIKLGAINPVVVWNPTRKKETFLMTPSPRKDFIWPFFGVDSCCFNVNPDLSNPKVSFGLGCAFTFTLGLDKPCTMFLEGSLRHATDSRVRVFLKGKDGKCRMLATSENPVADLAVEVEYGSADKRYKSKRLYLRLQSEFQMNQGDVVVFCCDKVADSHNRWTPVFYAWDGERVKSEPYLFVGEE